MRREVIAAASGAGLLGALAAGIALQGSGDHSTLHRALEQAANDTLAAYDCSIGIVGTDANPYRVERDTGFIAVRRMSEWRVVADCEREPTDTTGSVPDTVSLTGLPATLTVGDTVAVTGALLDSDGNEISTAPADWDVNITGGLGFVSYSGLTNIVHAAEAGPGSVQYTHLGSELVSEATTQISEPPDTTDPNVPAAATVDNPTPVVRVGDAVTIRPNLVTDNGTVIPTAAPEWSIDFDADFVSVSGFAVTALAETAPGASTRVVLTHDETGHAAEVEIVILAESEPGEWPDNEPAGLTTITHFTGNAFPDQLPGWNRVGRDTAFHRYSVVDDAGSKFGKALQKQYIVGDGDGWGDVGLGNNSGPRFAYANQTRHSEIYLRLVIQYSPNWQWHPAGNHTVSYQWNGRGANVDVLQRVPNHPVGGPEFPWGRARPGGYSWLPIIAGSPDLDTYQGNRGVIALRNAGFLPEWQRGQYHTVEVWLRRSDPGQINASMRFWFDGVEYQRFYGPGHCNDDSGCDVSFEAFRTGASDILTPAVELPVYWGGQGGVKNRPDWVRVSELYISGRR